MADGIQAGKVDPITAALSAAEHEILCYLSHRTGRNLKSPLWSRKPAETGLLDGLCDRGILVFKSGRYAFTAEGRKAFNLAETERASRIDAACRRMMRGTEEKSSAFLTGLNDDFAALRADPMASSEHDAEQRAWDATIGDGLEPWEGPPQ